MSIHKQYIKPETEIIHVDQECHLMAGSERDDTGMDEETPHDEVLDPSGQLAKPSGPFRRSMWED